MKDIQMKYKMELLRLKKCVEDMIENTGFVIPGNESEAQMIADKISPLIEVEIHLLSGSSLIGKLDHDLSRLNNLLEKLSAHLANKADKSIFLEFDAMLESLSEENF